MSKILDANSPIATIFGGSGFVGKYLVRRLVKRGWRIRVAVRNPNEAIFLKTYGEVGQVDVFQCSIFDEEGLSENIPGSTVVINAAAGALNETSKKMFRKYYIDGPELIAQKCYAFNVKKFIHISSVGVDCQSTSLYSSSKALGEAAIIKKFPNVAIVRPSLIFGHEDRFFNRYASLATYSMFVPLIGNNTKFQPVYVDDVALAVEKIATEKALTGIFELGGPEILSFRQIIEKMLKIIRRKRLIINLPLSIAKILAIFFEGSSKMTFGLIPVPFTQDNVKQLKVDNVVSEEERSFKDLGIKPQNIDTIVPVYLYSYRPHGQYNEVTQSANKPS